MCYRTGKIYCLKARPCIFQPGYFTGLGSEGVNCGTKNGCSLTKSLMGLAAQANELCTCMDSLPSNRGYDEDKN